MCVKESEVRCDGVPHCWREWKRGIGGEDERNCNHIVSKVIDYTESKEEELEYYNHNEAHVDMAIYL